MHLIKTSLRLLAGLAIIAALPFLAAPTEGAEPRPSGSRFQTLRVPADPQTVTITRGGGHGWFEATAEGGKRVRVSLPPKFGWVERDGKLVPTTQLRAGDQVAVWGFVEGRRVHVARAQVVTPEHTATRNVRLVSNGCCAASATCTSCGSQCATCTSRADCESCCGASCCTSASCCA